MEKQKIYFGHPVNFYNIPKEAELIEIISKKFPQFSVENPNQSKHQQGYQEFKLKRGRGMIYYFEEVLPKMDAGIFLPFEDGMLGAGVYGEAKHLNSSGKPIYEINLEKEIKKLILDKSRFLSIEETRKRVYG